MTKYRKKILECYYIMISSQLLLAKAAFQLYMHFEMHEMDEYLKQGYEFNREMLDDIDDPVVKTINKFIYECDTYIEEMEKRNLLSEDDLDDYEDRPVVDNTKAVRVNNYAGLVIFYLRVYVHERIEAAMEALYNIKNGSGNWFKKTTNFDDDNLTSISAFKKGLGDLLDYLEKETGSIAEKKGW